MARSACARRLGVMRQRHAEHAATLEEIARVEGVSVARAGQLVDGALDKLRHGPRARVLRRIWDEVREQQVEWRQGRDGNGNRWRRALPGRS